MKRAIAGLACLFVFACPAWSQDPTTDTDNTATNSKITELEKQVEEIENRLNQPAPTPRIRVPDISFVGDFVWQSTSHYFSNSNLSVRDAELAVQGWLCPGIRADAFVFAEDFSPYSDETVELKEAYVTFVRLGNTDFTAQVGRRLLDFGLVNDVHPHNWPWVTQPLVYAFFFGRNGLVTEGVQAGYESLGRIRLGAQAGVYKPAPFCMYSSDYHEPVTMSGFDNRLYAGRLWAKALLPDKAELQLGTSAARGSTDTGVVTYNNVFMHGDNVALGGLDLAFSKELGDGRRFLIQGEALRHQWLGTTWDGHYTFADFAWNKSLHTGLRYDWCADPCSTSGHISSLSLVVSDQLTESMLWRMQVGRESWTQSSESDESTVAYLQLVWGFGPHSRIEMWPPGFVR